MFYSVCIGDIGSSAPIFPVAPVKLRGRIVTCRGITNYCSARCLFYINLNINFIPLVTYASIFMVFLPLFLFMVM